MTGWEKTLWEQEEVWETERDIGGLSRQVLLAEIC